MSLIKCPSFLSCEFCTHVSEGAPVKGEKGEVTAHPAACTQWNSTVFVILVAGLRRWQLGLAGVMRITKRVETKSKTDLTLVACAEGSEYMTVLLGVSLRTFQYGRINISPQHSI